MTIEQAGGLMASLFAGSEYPDVMLMSQVLRQTAKVNASGNDDQDLADAQEAGVNPPRWRASLGLVGAIVKAGEAVGHSRPTALGHGPSCGHG